MTRAICWLGATGTAVFATPSRLVLLLSAYLALHAALRLWLMPASLGYDDAEQVLFAQRFAIAYRFEQPPLVNWLNLAVSAATGLAPGLVTVTLSRSLLLAALYVFMYLAARCWLTDPMRAGIAAAALSATYTLGWLAHGDLPHSTALAVMVAAALWSWWRLVEQPTVVRTLVFGVVCGLGLLAKWNFVMLAAGFSLTGLAFARTRPLVLSWRTPLAILVCTLVAGPSALWVLVHHPSFLALADGVLVAPADAPTQPAWIAGLSALGLSALAFPQPLLALALVALWPARAKPAPGLGSLALLVVVVLALHAMLVPLTGALNFPERWMIVPLLALPILLLAMSRPGHPRVALFGGVLVLLAAVTLVVRGVIGMTDAAYCGKCRTRLPAAAFAEAVADAGFTHGTIVVDDMHLGGNLRLHLPEARIVFAGLPAGVWPPPGNGACVVAWRAPGTGEALRLDVARALGADLGAAPVLTVTAPIVGSSDREQAMAFVYSDGVGECR